MPDETYFTDTRGAPRQRVTRTARTTSAGQHAVPRLPPSPRARAARSPGSLSSLRFQDSRCSSSFDAHPDFVEPEIRRNEVRAFVEGGLNDLSVTRTTFDWGIPVPVRPRRSRDLCVVRCAAQLSHRRRLRCPTRRGPAELAYRWPAQLHIVGKDIIRFHCVIWPAMLMAVGAAGARARLAHGFLLVRNAETGKGEKIRGRGNAIAPRHVIDMLGVDGYRYYFMTDVVPRHRRCDHLRAHGAGLQRRPGQQLGQPRLALAQHERQVLRGRARQAGSVDAFDDPLATIADGRSMGAMAEMDALDYGGARTRSWSFHAANHYIEDTAPSALAKDPAKAESSLAFVIWNLVEAIRIAAHLLAPLTPSSSAEALRRLSCEHEASTFPSSAHAHGASLRVVCPSRRARRCSASGLSRCAPYRQFAVTM